MLFNKHSEIKVLGKITYKLNRTFESFFYRKKKRPILGIFQEKRTCKAIMGRNEQHIWKTGKTAKKWKIPA